MDLRNILFNIINIIAQKANRLKRYNANTYNKTNIFFCSISKEL